MSDPLVKLFEDPAELLQADKGDLFERIVEALFARLPGWKAKRPSKTNTPDQGLDVEAISPFGTRYLIQCKNLASPADASVVRLTHAAKDIHFATKAIVICPSGFTEPALRDAKLLGVLAWGSEELRLLYKAAFSEEALKQLGIWEAPPPPPKTQRRTPRFSLPRPLINVERKAFYAGLVAFAALALLAIAIQSSLGSKSPPRFTPQAVVKGYDSAYRNALSTNVLEPLYEWAFAEFVDRQIKPFVEERKRRGCVLKTEEVKPMRILSVNYDDINAEVRVAKHWKQTLVCLGRPPRVVLERPFETWYLLRYDEKNVLKVWYANWN